MATDERKELQLDLGDTPHPVPVRTNLEPSMATDELKEGRSDSGNTLHPVSVRFNLEPSMSTDERKEARSDSGNTIRPVPVRTNLEQSIATDERKELWSDSGNSFNEVAVTVLAGYEEDFASPTLGQDELLSKLVTRKRKRSLGLSTVESDFLNSLACNVSDSDAPMIGQEHDIGAIILQTGNTASHHVVPRQGSSVALISSAELKGPPSMSPADFKALTTLPSNSPDPEGEYEHECQNLNKSTELSVNVKIAAKGCRGITKSGKPCRMRKRPSVEHPFCTLHEWQQQGSREEIRTCDGMTKSGLPCKAQILHGPMLGPAFCGLHKDQQKLTSKFVCCFGKKSNGCRCHAYIEWKAPFFQFCTEHKDQAKSMTCPLVGLSSDVGFIVIGLLQPLERVSFALSSKACASFVKEWGQREQNEEELPRRYRSINLFGPHCAADGPRMHKGFRNHRQQHKPFLQASSNTSCHEHPFHYVYYRIPPTLPIDETYWGHRVPGLPACSCGYDRQLTEIHNHICSMTEVSPMQKAIRAAPWLFDIASKWMTRACIVCGTSPCEQDKTRYDGRYGTSKMDPEVFICHACENKRSHVAIRWCSRCKGQIPSVTACARAYWKAQPRNGKQNMNMTNRPAPSKLMIEAKVSVASDEK